MKADFVFNLTGINCPQNQDVSMAGDFILPQQCLILEESMELEGISIFENAIYLSYKRGYILSEYQIVLTIAKCSIPRELFE